jgi:hypothetical protein
MKIKNLLWCLLGCFAAFNASAQDVKPASQLKVVKLNCNDSLPFVTNVGHETKPCEFHFHYSEKTPTMFYVENFSNKDLYDLITYNDQSKIAIVKLVTPGYKPKVHDFIYCQNQNDAFMYYYILESWQEHKQLQEKYYVNPKTKL